MSIERARADDEQALNVIHLLRQGHSSADIGFLLQRSPGYARTLRNRIMAADLAESGEDADAVRRAYSRGGHG